MITDAQFSVETPDVGVHGMYGNAQFRGDLRLVLALKDALDDLKLPTTEPEHIGDGMPLPIAE